MAATLLTGFKQKIKDFTLIPAGGGCFEVRANGELLYSKLETGKFPNEQDVLEMIRAKLAG